MKITIAAGPPEHALSCPRLKPALDLREERGRGPEGLLYQPAGSPDVTAGSGYVAAEPRYVTAGSRYLPQADEEASC